jgi:Flp pilus assembly protein TadG
MSRQNPIFRRTTSATWHAIGTFMVGTDGIAGNALIEFAIIAPLLIVMCIYVIDFGFFSVRQMELNHATQAGAQYAVEHGYNPTNITSAVTNDANDSSFTISTTPSEFCGCPSSTGVTQLFTGDCPLNTTCPAACPPSTTCLYAGTYVTVSTTATYNTIAPVSGKLFTITVPKSYLLNGTATVRIK